MPDAAAAPKWREARRDAARALILEAAWVAVHEDGLTSLSLRRLAARAGVTTPTVYAYFPSKNAIYDAMFLEAAAQFEAHMTSTYDVADPEDVLIEGLHRFLDFCTTDTARYQLLFERVLPDFEPSADAYAPAVRALDNSRAHLRAAGVTQQRHVDLWTAVTTGLASQQIANDPGGRRWTDLAEDAAAMLLAHCRAATPSARRTPTRRAGSRAKEKNR
jgi:AcrR family transcriptional regulator